MELRKKIDERSIEKQFALLELEETLEGNKQDELVLNPLLFTSFPCEVCLVKI